MPEQQPTISASTHYFELFALPLTYSIDTQQLKKNYQALRQAVHPDRFTSAPAAQQRLALQKAAEINQAYKTLQDDVDRAYYLAELAGMDLQAGEITVKDPEFMMEQLELREQFDQLKQRKALQAVDVFITEVKSMLKGQRQTVASCFHIAEHNITIQDAEMVKLHIFRLQFLSKLLHEIQDFRHQLA